MKSKLIQINTKVYSQNELDRMNKFQKPKRMLEIRDQILLQYGEGPYKKCYVRRGQYPKEVIKKVRDEYKKKWPGMRFIVAHTIVRHNRTRRLDQMNVHGGLKLVIDALEWSGWIVNDHCKWFFCDVKPQTKGDDAIFFDLEIPETDEENKSLKGKYLGE